MIHKNDKDISENSTKYYKTISRRSGSKQVQF